MHIFACECFVKFDSALSFFIFHIAIRTICKSFWKDIGKRQQGKADHNIIWFTGSLAEVIPLAKISWTIPMDGKRFMIQLLRTITIKPDFGVVEDRFTFSHTTTNLVDFRLVGIDKLYKAFDVS